jgi:hypothetical protein
VVVFGDSPGDLEMAEQARAEGMREVYCVWVGEEQATGYPVWLRVHLAARTYAAGTAAVLRSLTGAPGAWKSHFAARPTTPR